jgi:hypothetical protein
MLGDPVDKGFGLITSWPLVPLILALILLALADVNSAAAAMLRRIAV